MLNLYSDFTSSLHISSKMRKLPYWCGDALFVTAILFLVLPSAFSMHNDLRGERVGLQLLFKRHPHTENTISNHMTKRDEEGHDPWSLCPHTMSNVDCFYEYLRVYARLRREGMRSNGSSERIVGKRSLK